MRMLKNLLSTLLGLALLGALAAGLYFGLRAVAGLFAGLDETTAALAAIAALTVLLSVLLLAWSRQHAAGQERREQLRLQRAEVYSLLLEIWAAYMHRQAHGGAPETLRPEGDLQELENDLQAVERQLLLWGSSAVVRQYAAYQAHQQTLAPPEVSPLIEKVILEMRRDLGVFSIGLREGDLGGLLLTDDGAAAPERGAPRRAPLQTPIPA